MNLEKSPKIWEKSAKNVANPSEIWYNNMWKVPLKKEATYVPGCAC